MRNLFSNSYSQLQYLGREEFQVKPSRVRTVLYARAGVRPWGHIPRVSSNYLRK